MQNSQGGLGVDLVDAVCAAAALAWLLTWPLSQQR